MIAARYARIYRLPVWSRSAKLRGQNSIAVQEAKPCLLASLILAAASPFWQPSLRRSFRSVGAE